MTASSIDGADWLAAEREALARVDLKPEAQSVGRVEEIADGVARVSGLPEARLGELLRFEGGRMGYALSLEREAINAAIFDEAEAIGVGSLVSATGEVARVPVGPGLLGRVVDPLGRPLDRDEPIAAEAFHPIERPAPAIIDRALVSEPVATGVLVVDALFALGRGQRELIIGDRATGKTAIAVDTIINQKRSDMICVYVAVGQRATAVERVIEAVRQYGAPERCVFVVASAASSAALQWIAPFAGFTIAEYFRDRGGHALVDRRRSDQARRDPSRARAADPRAARPRGLPGRHLLRPRAPARARRQALARARRRLADRAADRRDRRRQSLRLHPDQPHLDHRRPDRARFAPVRRQPAPGGRRRPERQPRRRQGAGAGAARGVRPAPARLFAVSRTRDVHPLRRHRRHPRARRRSRAASASARCSPSRASPRCASSIRSRCCRPCRTACSMPRRSPRCESARPHRGAARRAGARDGRRGHEDRGLRRGRARSSSRRCGRSSGRAPS